MPMKTRSLTALALVSVLLLSACAADTAATGTSEPRSPATTGATSTPDASTPEADPLDGVPGCRQLPMPAIALEVPRRDSDNGNDIGVRRKGRCIDPRLAQSQPGIHRARDHHKPVDWHAGQYLELVLGSQPVLGR